MNTSLHITFNGQCDEAFAFYESVFGTKRKMTMRWSDAPPPMKCPPGAENRVMHTALDIGSIVVMGADAPPEQPRQLGGYDISVDSKDEAEVRRIFAALSEGGKTSMPLQKTFWSPLFGMCTDRFGVSWMVTITDQSVNDTSA